MGGGAYKNERFDLEREVLHKQLKMGARSMWHTFPFPLAPAKRFGVIGDDYGAVTLYLPYRAADSGDMGRPNTFKELASYRLAEGEGTVNVLDLLTDLRQAHPFAAAGLSNKPVDLVVARVDGDTLLVQRGRDNQALIRKKRVGDETLFEYAPTRSYSADNGLVVSAAIDPFGYLTDSRFCAGMNVDALKWLQDCHTSQEWLRATCRTDYPDAVVSLTRCFGRDKAYAGAGADDADPDLLVFASRGWVFLPTIRLDDRRQDPAGSCHGTALRESVNNTMFFSGPGIRKGCVVDAPHRMVDLVPTLLVMASKEWKGLGLDGAPIEGIWDSHAE
jgi:hypothetical protein